MQVYAYYNLFDMILLYTLGELLDQLVLLHIIPGF